MKSTVAIYDSHWTALDAVEVLKSKCYPVDKLSIIGQAKSAKEINSDKSSDSLLRASSGIAVVLDSSLTVLSRARILAVPELGFLFGAGAIVGAIANSTFNLAGMAIVTVLTAIGINKERVENYKQFMNEGKFLVVAQGDDSEVEIAKNILHNCARPIDLAVN